MPSFLFLSLSYLSFSPFHRFSWLVSLLRSRLFFDFSLAVLEGKGTLTLTRTSICPSVRPSVSFVRSFVPSFVRSFVRTYAGSECGFIQNAMPAKIDVDIYWMRNDAAQQRTTLTLYSAFFSLRSFVYRSLDSLVNYIRHYRKTRIIPRHSKKTLDSILISISE